MGARSNIVIQDGEDRIWLYGHWMGCSAVDHAAHGLRSDRYDQASYLARIVFSSMVAGLETSETGFGISTRITDNQYPVLVIDSRFRGLPPDGRGRADVWFETGRGEVVSPAFTREEFLAIADTNEPHRYGWDIPPHDCGYGRFFRPSDQFSDV